MSVPCHPLHRRLIPAVTIPVALVGTLAAIWLTGFSINTISLLALVLATGLVVDDAIVEAILTSYRESGEITSVQSIIGVRGGTNAFIIVRLPDWADRDRSQQETVTDINRQLSAVPGVQVSVRSTNSLNIRGAGQGLTFAVTGNNVEDMTNAAEDLVAAMGADGVFLNPQLSNDSVEAQLELRVDDKMAGAFGLTEAEITETVSALVQGNVAVSVFQDDTETDVNLVPGGPPINDPSDLESVFLRLPDGEYVPLSVLATLETIVSSSQIERQGGSLAVSAQANLVNGVVIGAAMVQLDSLAKETLPDDMNIGYTGEAATLKDGQTGFYLVFGVALLVVFLVLSAQFESFVSAIVILLTVPFGLAAALMAISLTGGSLNYYSQIGLVMLIGVMAKNGILIVEFANQLREAGQDMDSAIRDAMRLRIRPVMMTMVSTVCGGLPLIFTSGAGAEARIAVGWVIVGGLGFATTFTLFLTPVLYRWITVWGNEPGMAAKRLGRERQIPAGVS